ncbi:MAG: HEAT repeat domain-containing protein, partial [Microcystis panniformis]
KFQQALAQRPNDNSAQNAIADTQKVLGQTGTVANAAAKNENLPIPLIAGSALLSIALLAALLSLFFQYRPKGKASKRREKTTYANPKNPLDNFSRGNGNPFGADTKTGSDINGSGDEDFDPSLPVQATSRIPNVDLILR